MKQLTHEDIAKLARALGIAPWHIIQWEERIPDDVVPLFRKVLALEKEFESLNLPYMLQTTLVPR